jgi:uncharacterized protein (TIGR00730 family)
MAGSPPSPDAVADRGRDGAGGPPGGPGRDGPERDLEGSPGERRGFGPRGGHPSRSGRERPSPTGDAELDRRIEELLDAVGAVENRDQLTEIFASAVRLAASGTDRLDLKITNAALAEMAEAFRVFSPYRAVKKVTMFGSARTLPELAAALARAGWMVVTGAGPGIMAAGLEGAGRARAFGINIRLPFEQGANEVIAKDPKLVEMKYFFTRKLMLMKESDGFVVLPGGFGTLDEAFELLTLVQTGKAEPSPIVLLDVPGGTYWRRWEQFVAEEVAGRGLISPDDVVLYRITDDVDAAAAEILGFYRNYHSRRFIGDLLVLRLKAPPTPGELEDLNRRFADICLRGSIHPVPPLPPERSEQDHLDLPRVAFVFDRVHHGRLRQLIDALNALSSAPALAPIEKG